VATFVTETLLIKTACSFLFRTAAFFSITTLREYTKAFVLRFNLPASYRFNYYLYIYIYICWY
jgi:hypothetical protein